MECRLGEWTEQGCSVTCGGGTQLFTRPLLSQPEVGPPCGPLNKTAACNIHPCPGEAHLVETRPNVSSPVECQLSEWRSQGCSTTCGSGVEKFTRSLVSLAGQAGQAEASLAGHGGLHCGELTKEKPCNTQPCPGKGHASFL